jgi:hypothetical protein
VKRHHILEAIKELLHGVPSEDSAAELEAIKADAATMDTGEHEALADAIHVHMEQVKAGLIPADSPIDFTKPLDDDALIDGKPWWWGSEFGEGEMVDPEAQEAMDFSDPPRR